ncbi:NAD(P)-binding protein [Rhizodiscina lignyota]|uniref:NAD(P)-binding protein n=1 Tax=Rhizodiscina lignyota TaxID=1504668 RepID=A0A9P4M462_9PEZI|nr:NAD(P)-binding protein [Rhizodiscina lignyota]
MSDGTIHYIYDKWIKLPADPTTSFSGKTILITGANSGIGLQACIKFAKLGASKIIAGVRNLEKGNAAKETIENVSKRTGVVPVVEVWQLDLDSYDSIKSFAARASKDLQRLDVAILNAGVRKFSYVVSKYGWEETIQVNTLSNVLLALLLLPKLQENPDPSSPSSLQFITSGLHRGLKVKPAHREAANIIESYSSKKAFGENAFLDEGADQYAASKLFIMCAMKRIAASVQHENQSSSLIVTASCPGYVKSGIGREFSSNPFRYVLKSMVEFVCMRSTEAGSRIFVSGATLGEKGQGKFWRHDAVQPDAAEISGEKGRELIDKVWHDILTSLSKDMPEVVDLAKNIK